MLLRASAGNFKNPCHICTSVTCVGRAIAIGAGGSSTDIPHVLQHANVHACFSGKNPGIAEVLSCWTWNCSALRYYRHGIGGSFKVCLGEGNQRHCTRRTISLESCGVWQKLLAQTYAEYDTQCGCPRITRTSRCVRPESVKRMNQTFNVAFSRCSI